MADTQIESLVELFRKESEAWIKKMQKYLTFMNPEDDSVEWEIKKQGETVLYMTLFPDRSVHMIGGHWAFIAFGYKNLETFLDMAIDD